MAKDDSKKRFLDAGHAILAAGMELGVNAVAKQAGLNKVLLYRYFTDWDGFLEQLVAGLNLWKQIRIELVEGLGLGRWPDPAAASLWVLQSYQENLRQEIGIQTIMANEQARSSPLLRHLDKERETEGVLILEAILKSWPSIPPGRAALVSGLLSAGISHLVLRSRQVRIFNGLDLGAAATWEALMVEIGQILRSLLV